MASLRARFGERLREDAAELTRALDSGDHDGMRRIAHRLSGAAGMFGYPQLSEQGCALEEAIDSGMADQEVQDLAAALLLEIADGLGSPFGP